MEKLNFKNFSNKNFGKIEGRNYHKKNRLPKMKNAMEKNLSAKMEGPLKIGQAVYNTEVILKSIFDENLMNEIKIQSYKNKKIYLTVSNSLIAQELKFEKNRILSELKNKFIVKELIITTKAKTREDYF